MKLNIKVCSYYAPWVDGPCEDKKCDKYCARLKGRLKVRGRCLGPPLCECKYIC